MSYAPPTNETHYRRHVQRKPIFYWFLASQVPLWGWLAAVYLVDGSGFDPFFNWILLFEVAFAIPTIICLASLALIQITVRKKPDFHEWKKSLLTHLAVWPIIGAFICYLLGALIASNTGSSVAEATPTLILFLGSVTIFVTLLNMLFGLYVVHVEKKNHPEGVALATDLT